MALIQVRVFEAWIETTGDPAVAVPEIDGGSIAADTLIFADLAPVNPTGGTIVVALAAGQIDADLEPINPSGGLVVGSLDASSKILADLETDG